MRNRPPMSTGFIILAVTAVALTIGIAACDGDGDESPQAMSPAVGVTPTATEEAAETPKPTPTPTTLPETVEPSTTAVRRYELPAALPDPASLPVVDCWFSSVSTGRTDAFRCMTEDSFIHDPCFLDMDTMVLACPDDPRDDSTTFFAAWGGESGNPDEVRGEATEPERLWFLVVDAPGDPTCRFLTGATMVLPGDARMDFDCAGPCTSPEPADGEDLVISCYPGVEQDWAEEEMLSVETQYTIAEAWY